MRRIRACVASAATHRQEDLLSRLDVHQALGSTSTAASIATATFVSTATSSDGQGPDLKDPGRNREEVVSGLKELFRAVDAHGAVILTAVFGDLIGVVALLVALEDPIPAHGGDDAVALLAPGRVVGAAGRLIGCVSELAPIGGVAGVDGTVVLVVTVERFTRDALALHTDVFKRADVSIRARTFVVLAHASVHRVTPVIGAGVLVVTGHQLVEAAQAIAARVSEGARVLIVARTVCGREDAGARVTDLARTWVAVVAVHGRTALARALAAGVDGRTGISVRARNLDGCVLTALERLACVRCARIAVIAIDGPHGYAGALPAHVEVRARVAVLALGLVRREHASNLGITAVIGAAVLVIA
jgi:hypothetical protein